MNGENTDPVGEHTDAGLEDAEPVSGGTARKTALAVGAVLLGLVIVLALAVSTRDDDGDAGSGLLGQRVPEVAGQDVLTGAEFDIQQTRGQWVIVNFFGTWCPGCLVEHPELVSFERWADANDVEMLSLVVNEPGERAASFFAEEGGSWHVVPDGRASIDFAVAQLPETFVVSPDGTVIAHFQGSVTEAQLRGVIPIP